MSWMSARGIWRAGGSQSEAFSTVLVYGPKQKQGPSQLPASALDVCFFSLVKFFLLVFLWDPHMVKGNRARLGRGSGCPPRLRLRHAALANNSEFRSPMTCSGTIEV